jgi:hypothetical protein
MNLSTKTLLSTVLCFGLAISAMAQGKKNISKINLLPGPVFHTFGVSQEFKLAERISIQTMVKLYPPMKVSKIPTSGTYDGTTYNPFTSAKLFGIGNITEFRIYGKEKGAFRGFYWGPYFATNLYKFQTSTFRADFTDKKTNTVYSADVSQFMKLTTVSGGLEIGLQGLIKNLVAFDWTILGISVGSAKLSGGIEASNTSANFDFNNYEDDIKQAALGLDKILPMTRTIEPQKVELGIRAIVPFFRTGIAIGINY